jgi:hypothetical protein
VKASRVGVMFYAGQLNLTVAADRDGCPGIEVFTHGTSDTDRPPYPGTIP